MLDLQAAFAQPQQVEIHARHRPPDMFVDQNGALSGPLVDIVNRAAEIADVTPNWQVRPIAFSLGALEQGIDIVLPRLYRSSDRDQYVDFHGPFQSITKHVLFITDNARSFELNELSDLFGKKMGVRMRGFYGTLIENDARLNRQTFTGEEQLINELRRGMIDVIAITNLAAFERVAEELGYDTWSAADFALDQDEAIWIGTVKGSASSTALGEAFQMLVDNGEGRAVYDRHGLANN